MIKRLIKLIKNPKLGLLYLLNKECIARLFSDKAYLKLKYYLVFGKKLNLDNPVTFNEKIQWLKLYDRKPEYTMMVDKYAVRQYIADKIGEEYLIQLLGVWDSPDEIDFDSLPDQFVLKCNHNSGLGMVICKDKSKLDIEAAKRELRKGLKQDYFITSIEWPYKNVKRKIIAEKFLDSGKTTGLTDYKFFCFNGDVKFLYVSDGLDNHDTASISFLSIDWERLPFERCDYKSHLTLPERPKNLGEMLDLASTLSSGIPFLRVDLYEVDGKVYFSELTFYTGCGFTPFNPDVWDQKLGSLIQLP